ncbi:Zona pellucida sperm-binding protein 3 [Bagarius yarrelli]|uniref:Zona pellucida sperm-binding protein 3 n=1 Tax=Bagarius yarrelli TaxID=175774 RepID=A0A556TKL3_BAGYA|nr:Zona pellucida sperm-binding protein 3 [Bagarius yarrelli]
MLLKAVFLLVGLRYMVSPSPFVSNTVSDDVWPELENSVPRFKTIEPGSPSLSTPCPPLKLPESQPIDFSAVQKSMFEPARKRRPVPSEIRAILLPTPSSVTTTTPPSEPKVTELLCHVDRIYVRVRKRFFSSPNAAQYLKVGTCTVNKDTPEYYYFLYPINDCNVQREENENHVLYSNTLSYEPVNDGPFIRETPFSVQLECYYNKHFRSYSVGFLPKIQSGTVFLSLLGGVTLTPVNEFWEPLTDWQSYTFGQPMYFEARIPYSRDNKRLYIKKCHFTASSNPDSTPNFVVIDNSGCMVDGKHSPHSKFYPTEDVAALRFALGALMFQDMIKLPTEKREMFLHCEMILGPEIPSSSAKACSYNKDTNRWTELYGDDPVCACCDDSCPVLAQSGLSHIVSPSPFVSNTASDDTWVELEDTVPRFKTHLSPSSATPCPPLMLPESQPIDFSAVQKSMFEPARIRRPVPDEMKTILLPKPSPVTTTPLPSEPKVIELLCHVDRIYVRVLRSLLTDPNAEQYLKVGTCSVNKNTAEYYYFLYPIDSCDVQRDENEDRVLYSNTLTYEPVTSGPVVREMGFSVPLECHYNKHFRSYSAGVQPKIQSGTVTMNLRSVVVLRPVDENWNPVDVLQNTTVGQPLYFEAKAPGLVGKRLFLNMCHVTASQNSDALPKYTVIDNSGCMVDGKNTYQSKFYPSEDRTTVRFSIGALLFKDSPSTESTEMFIHCEMTLEDDFPTASAKSCSYNTDSGGVYLYVVSMKISSRPWNIKNTPDLPAMKSAALLKADAEPRGGFEMVWDVFGKLT